MELQLLLPDSNPKNELINLKNFIDRASIDGMEITEIARSEQEEITHTNGQMGAGEIIAAVRTIIEAAAEPLTQLVKCLERYVNNYRTTITIATKKGNEIKLEHGRSMTPEQLKDIVVAIQNGME